MGERWRAAIREPDSAGLLLLAAVWLVSSAWFLYAWPFGFDEFEHLHAAWLVSQGSTPYVDFVEEHDPLLWLLLQPLLRIWPENASIIYGARVGTWVALILAALVLVATTRRVFERRTGLWAAGIWLTSMPVLAYGFQSRPDTAMMLMLLLSVWLLVRPPAGRLGAGWLAASGAAWAIGFLFLQKALLFLPVLGILLAVRRGGSLAALARRAAWWCAGCALPMALGGGWLLSRGALGAWWRWGFLFSRTAPAPPPGSRTLGFSLGFYPLLDVATETSTVATLLAAAGAVRLFHAWRTRSRLDGTASEIPGGRKLRLAAALGLGGSLVLLVSLAVVRRPSPWYVIPVLATLAMLAAHGTRWCLQLARRRGPAAERAVALVIAALVVTQPLAWLSGLSWSWQGNAPAMAREAFARCVAGEDDVVFQGGAEFNLFRRDASVFWYDPFEQSRRAATIGLPTMPPFETLVRRERPVVISLYPYLEDRFDAFLRNSGYAYEPDLRLYYRPLGVGQTCEPS